MSCLDRLASRIEVELCEGYVRNLRNVTRRGVRILRERDLARVDLYLSASAADGGNRDRNVVLRINREDIVGVEDLELEIVVRGTHNIGDNLDVAGTGAQLDVAGEVYRAIGGNGGHRIANLRTVDHKLHVLDVRDIRGTDHVEVKVLKVHSAVVNLRRPRANDGGLSAGIDRCTDGG